MIGPGLLLVAALAAPRPADDWRTWLEVGTDVPTQVSATVRLVAPGRVRLFTGVGWLPPGYVQLANQVATQVGDYTVAQADAVAAALQDSLVWQIGAGWQPWADLGLTVDLGYQLLTLGGSATGETLLAIATSQSAPDRDTDQAPGEYTLGLTVHRLRLAVGWTWWLGEAGDWSVSAQLGGELTLGNTATVDPTFGGFQVRRAEAFAARAEASLSDIINTYLHSPTVGVAVGYRLD